MTDLNRLIEAVEGGVDTAHHHAAAFPSESAYGKCTWHDSHKASSGSLDAAKALHEALLPGWRVAWLAEMLDREDGWEFRLTGQKPHQGEYATNEISARAWLLAILKAHRAQIGAEG